MTRLQNHILAVLDRADRPMTASEISGKIPNGAPPGPVASILKRWADRGEVFRQLEATKRSRVQAWFYVLGFRCYLEGCDSAAVRAVCIAGDPWYPCCAKHSPYPPSWELSGDIPIGQLPQAMRFIKAVLR